MKILLQPILLLITILLISVHINIVSVFGLCLKDQQASLLQLKQNLTFDPALSTKLVTWNSSTDCCSWDGVTCYIGLVIGLDLSNESISDGIDNSSSLFDLQYLQTLNLACNSFKSIQIPSRFDKLTQLTYLNLSNTNFAGQIPIEISHLTKLVTLDFSAPSFITFLIKLENPNLNKLVRNLTELTELHLDGVNILPRGNEWCQALSSSLPNLRVLSLSNCNLSGPIDSSLQKLQSLSVIRLDNNNLSAPVPEFVVNFTNLTSLRLSSSGLRGTFPEKILQVPTLQTLDLSNNKQLQGSLPDFNQSGSLQTLVLSSTSFSGTIPSSIGNLKMLSRIDLMSCNFNGTIPNSMANLTELVYLDLSFNRFIGPIPSFSLLSNLTNINLAHNRLNGSISSTDWEVLSDLVNLDLRSNSLSGEIPLSLFSIPLLQKLQLSQNQFTGQLNELPYVSYSQLDTLDLDSNKLEGPFPMAVFGLHDLKILTLSSNNFSGPLELSAIQQLRNLSNLDLSYNSLSVNATANDSTSSSFPQITTLKLASCNLMKFPDFLKNQYRLAKLDLSNNQISGKIPNWIWEIGHLLQLNLSHNFLVNVGEPSQGRTSTLSVLDLHANQLQGQIPILPPFATYLDYSSNNFSSIVPATIGDYLTITFFFSLSSNNFHGSIPESICSASYLQILDLSNNSLSGMIPPCLTMMMNLGVLNLRRNKLNATISDNFQKHCGLQTLDVNGNLLEGKIPKSLANCSMLQVLDLGNNQINDTFPRWLKNVYNLHVLVLRSNNYHGPIDCPENNTTWPLLQIIDLASNKFSGKLPQGCLTTWEAMMDDDKNEAHDHLRFDSLGLSGLYYQNAITVTSKGQQMELVKILTVFTSIDLSCNNFQGPIPEVIGAFKALHILNLSHNAFTGQIPSSFGNMRQLESLDLSSNYLSGTIPPQLANLTFLSFLNLSYNQLVGRIPTGTQLQSFSDASFKGNKGLCGLPLEASCSSPPKSDETHLNSSNKIDWNWISAELGFAFGFGIVIGPLMLWRRWRRRYYGHVNRVLFRFLPQLGQRGRRAYRGRRSYRNLRMRR